MRVLKVPQSGAKKKLLDAAERLVAEKGFDLVSVRDITGAVKANVAAVNYHFGSREGLMDLVMMRTLEPLCEHRANALHEVQSKTGSSSIGELISAYVDSLVAAASGIDMDQKLYLRMAGRILVLPDSALAPSLAFTRREVREKYLEALTAALPATPSHELSATWDFFEAGIAQSLLSNDTKPDDWINIGVRCFAGSETHAKVSKRKDAEPEKAKAQAARTEAIEAAPPVEAQVAEPAVPAPEVSEPAKPEPTASEEKKSGNNDKQEMLFDF